MNIWIYDIEQYVNFTCIGFLNADTPKSLIARYVKADIANNETEKKEIFKDFNYKRFLVYKTINDIDRLKMFVNHEIDTLVGYNSYKYDDILLDYLCIYPTKSVVKTNTDLFNLSGKIISSGDYNFRWEEPFKNYDQPYTFLDIMKMLYLDKRRVSLKQLSILLKWYRVQELPIDPHSIIEDKDVYPILDYNFNDILITNEAFWNKIEEFKIRLGINTKYNVNVTSESRSSTANKILIKLYSDTTGLKPWNFTKLRTDRRFIKVAPIIDPHIEFESITFQNLLAKLKDHTIEIRYDGADSDTFTEKIIFADNIFNIKLGGLHSEDRPGVFIPAEDEELIDADVSSFYPKIVVNLYVCPKHLDSSAWNYICTIVTDGRLEAKAAGRKIEAEALKIVANSGIFGKYGDDYSWLKDKKCLFTVTINGQLYLLNLVERFHLAGIKVISANTDGVVCVVRKDQKEEYLAICKQWEEDFNFSLEYINYVKYVRQDVNNYMCIKENGSFKKKGCFQDEIELDKGYDKPIIAMAVQEYFKNNVNLDRFFTEHLKKTNGIYDFCSAQKVGSDFQVEFHKVVNGEYVVTPLQKNIRYFISNNGGTLMKRKKDTDKVISIVANQRVTIFNNYFDADNYDVKINYYKAAALDIINKVNGYDMKTIKGRGGKHPKSGISGKLFDELND